MSKWWVDRHKISRRESKAFYKAQLTTSYIFYIFKQDVFVAGGEEDPSSKGRHPSSTCVANGSKARGREIFEELFLSTISNLTWKTVLMYLVCWAYAWGTRGCHILFKSLLWKKKSNWSTLVQTAGFEKLVAWYRGHGMFTLAMVIGPSAAA